MRTGLPSIPFLLIVTCPLATPAALGAEPADVRVAVFNIWELSAEKLKDDDHPQLCAAAEVIQRVRPDVLLVNEIDYDGASAGRFLERFLQVSQNGQDPIDYPHVFYRPVNTGVPSGEDLDNDGRTDGPADGYGFGNYPGQYGMALYSRFPIDAEAARTFQMLKWESMPGNLMPDGNAGKPTFFDTGEVDIFRLSSKSHWDVPVTINGTVVHMLCSHPTPPVFDGEEDHNGRRNYDEVRLWADYLTGGDAAAYIRDDSGKRGGLPADAKFVILGDLNADPVRGDTVDGKRAIRQLLDHPRVNDPEPSSKGAAESRRGDRPDAGPYKTSGFGRIDYALPSRDLDVAGSGVFWPAESDPLHRLVADRLSSDHRLVWVDLKTGEKGEEESVKPIRAMTFNIRYGTANDGENRWDNRKDFLVETIKAFDPDLLGTQETLKFQRDYLAEQLPGYDHFGVGRDDGKDAGEMMAVFYKRDRFARLDGGHFWLSETPDVVGSKSWDSSLPRMATWLKLRDKTAPDARPILFVNTHFDHRGREARLESAKLLRRKVAELGDGCDVIVTGDFNAGEGSEPYAALFGGESPVVDVYRVAHPEKADAEGTSTGFRASARAGSRIDWIAASAGWKVGRAEIDRTARDGRTPSDHFPVIAVLSRG